MTNRHLFFLALPLLLAGCAQDEIEPAAADGGIIFNIGFTGQSSQTRVATDGDFRSSWQEGDRVGVFAVPHGQPLAASDNSIQNVRLTFDGNGWVQQTPLYWPQDGTRFDFYAYYPYNEGVTDPTDIAFAVKLDQSGANYSASDLMTARTADRGRGEQVVLSFSHALAMVQLTVSDRVGSLDTSEEVDVKLHGVVTGATLDLGGTATTNGTPTDITMHRVAEAEGFVFRALVPAQTVAQGKRLFHITNGELKLASASLPSDMVFEAGRVETFTQATPLTESNARAVFTDGKTGTAYAETIQDGVTEIVFSGAGNRTVYSLTLDEFPDKTYLIGRRDDETVSLKLAPGTGDLLFRDADTDGNIPIGTYDELAMLDTDDASRDGNYIQESDLDLLGAASLPSVGLERMDWESIGYGPQLIGLQMVPFTGNYEGNNKTIANIYDHDTIDGGISLFGLIEVGSTLSNLGIVSGEFGSGGEYNATTLCSRNHGTITNCYNMAKVWGNSNVSGLCGWNEGTIENCYNAGEVSGASGLATGICAINYGGTIIGCYNTGMITKDSLSAGISGICSLNSFGYDDTTDVGSIIDCHNRAAITGATGIAGICYQNTNGLISGCSNTGALTAGWNNVAGICCTNHGAIVDCRNEGAITGREHIGGICSESNHNSTHDGPNGPAIIDCHNTGAVTGQITVGGICAVIVQNQTVGPFTFYLSGCHNAGMVRGTNFIGGICGDARQTTSASIEIIACRNSGEVEALGDYVGGVCGRIGGSTMTACYNVGDMDILLGNVGYLYGSAQNSAITACYFTRGDGYGEFWNGNGEAFAFGPDSWPTVDMPGWGAYTDGTDGNYWSSTGGWNGGNPVYPRLHWEQ